MRVLFRLMGRVGEEGHLEGVQVPWLGAEIGNGMVSGI